MKKKGTVESTEPHGKNVDVPLTVESLVVQRKHHLYARFATETATKQNATSGNKRITTMNWSKWHRECAEPATVAKDKTHREK